MIPTWKMQSISCKLSLSVCHLALLKLSNVRLSSSYMFDRSFMDRGFVFERIFMDRFSKL